MVCIYEILTTSCEDGVTTVTSSGPMDADELFRRLPEELLPGDIFNDKIYAGARETIQIADNLSIFVRCDTEPDALTDEQFEAFSRDAKTRIEIVHAGQQNKERYLVTFVPEHIAFTIDLSSSPPHVTAPRSTTNGYIMTESGEYRNKKQTLRPGADIGDYAEVALDRAEAFDGSQDRHPKSEIC